MSRRQEVLQVLVASPSDVGEERETIDAVVTELNNTLGARLPVRLELIRWESHTRPGVGTDAQDVINGQLADPDVFVGVMWTRLGTSTERAPSGTVEEFRKAHERFRLDPTKTQLLMYLSEEPVSLTDIDLDQLKGVKDFEQELRHKGVFRYRRPQFESLIRNHLTRLLLDWTPAGWPPRGGPAAPKSTPVAVSIAGADPDRLPDEPQGKIDGELDSAAINALPSLSNTRNHFDESDDGFLDLIEEGQAALEDATLVIADVTTAVKTVGASIQKRASELATATAENRNDIRRVKQVVNAAAGDLEEYVDQWERARPKFVEATSRGVRAIGRAAVLSVDFGESNTGMAKGWLKAG